MRVAALADVHGNAPALEAVLADVERAAVELIVFCGDLTWGPFPRETIELVRELETPTRFVRGNADRAVGIDERPRGRWLAAQHTDEERRWVNGFDELVHVDVDGLGATLFCHGSPRSDEELVTPQTPIERVREMLAGIDERVVVTAHVHVQYDRRVADVRMVGPGSVGLPYEGVGGRAFWAVFGPDVELRETAYDVGAAAERIRATEDPAREVIAELMLSPPTRDEAIAHAEQRVFSA